MDTVPVEVAAGAIVEDFAETLRGHRVLRLVGKGKKPATMPLTVPACGSWRPAVPLAALCPELLRRDAVAVGQRACGRLEGVAEGLGAFHLGLMATAYEHRELRLGCLDGRDRVTNRGHVRM